MTSTSDEASGVATAKRAEIADAAPRALDHKAQIRYLQAVQARSSPRDRALARVPFYAGARIAETVALDIDDIGLSARKGILRIYGKGQRVREISIHPQLRKASEDWLHERRDWPRAGDGPALLVNQCGQRLSVRGAHYVITGIAARAGLDESVTAHVLRHSFATTLVRGGTDLIIAAELLGHARLETTGATRAPAPRSAPKPSTCCLSRSGALQARERQRNAAIAGFGRILAVPPDI